MDETFHGLGNDLGQRIWILGPPGAGKTTLARQLCNRLALPHYELDELFWRENWRQSDPEEFQARVAHITHCEQWIVDGQYDMVHPTLAESAETVIWLDPSPLVVLVRVVRRSLRRFVWREPLCNGNRETVRSALDLFVWAARTYIPVRRRNRSLLAWLGTRGISCARLRTAADRDRLMRAVEAAARNPAPGHLADRPSSLAQACVRPRRFRS
jgi:adenylate kinase family enzyme